MRSPKQSSELPIGVQDAEFFQASPKRRLIAVNDRLVEILFQILDRFDHARIRATQKIAVGVSSSIFLDDVFPLLRRYRRVSVRFQTESQLMQHGKAGLGEIVDFELAGSSDEVADHHDLLDARLIDVL